MSFSDTEDVFLDVALLFGDFKGKSFSLNDYLGKHRSLIASHLVIMYTNHLEPKSYLTLTLNLLLPYLILTVPLPYPYPT